MKLSKRRLFDIAILIIVVLLAVYILVSDNKWFRDLSVKTGLATYNDSGTVEVGYDGVMVIMWGDSMLSNTFYMTDDTDIEELSDFCSNEKVIYRLHVFRGTKDLVEVPIYPGEMDIDWILMQYKNMKESGFVETLENKLEWIFLK